MSPIKSDRSRVIQAAIKEPSAKSEMGRHPVVVGGEKKLLDVYKLRTKLLAYNIRNGRFAAELRAKEKQLGRHLDPLLPEDEEIIRNLLLALDDSATELLKADLRKVGQTDPGIITHDGFVINGNRRMAVLYLLHGEDPSGKYESIEVQVLPEGVSEKDLWRIEAGLQLSRDSRLEYGPVNDLLKIREGLKSGLTAAEIKATLYGIRNEDEVKEKDARLTLIDNYLEFVGEPEDYTKVKGIVEHFINLQDLLRRLKKNGVAGAERHKWLLRAFELIRSGAGHMDIRLLRNIAASETAKAHFLKTVTPKPGFRKTKEDEETKALVKEQFSIAKDYVVLEGEVAKPERLVSRAQRAISTLLKHKKEVVANESLHAGVLEIATMIDDLAHDCRKATPPRRKRK